jgi:hypothetical protein
MAVSSELTSAIQLPATGFEARTLDRLSQSAEEIDGVWTDSVEPGDWIVVRTRNSMYSLAPLGRGRFRVTGGWFAQNGGDQEVRIAGCTWGGAAIHTRLLAAVGMFLEFDNGVRTTRIRDVRVIRGGEGRPH